MTNSQKVADKASTSTSNSTSISAGAKADDAKVSELSVKEIEDRLAFANAARCDSSSETA